MLKPIKIGNNIINTPIFLAPMAGITDAPFRNLVESFGANMIYSEMISSNAIIRDSNKSIKMASLNLNSNAIQGIQFAGSDIPTLIEACKIAEDLGANLIDINMGCPVKKVTKGIAGSALMQNECLAGNIMESLVKSTNIPVTVKMRLGWDFNSINAPSLAKIAENSGIKLVTVHGRTRQQFFNDTADWQTIAKVKQAVNIPIIANGDIKNEEDAKIALMQSGADGVMIGRATYGKPWLINQISHYFKTGEKLPEPTLPEKLKTALFHLDMLMEHYGALNGIKIARKHLGWYTKGLNNSSDTRAAINTLEDSNQIKDLLKQCFDKHIEYINATSS
jgi:tRNA-dihydrouridine synthase B